MRKLGLVAGGSTTFARSCDSAAPDSERGGDSGGASRLRCLVSGRRSRLSLLPGARAHGRPRPRRTAEAGAAACHAWASSSGSAAWAGTCGRRSLPGCLRQPELELRQTLLRTLAGARVGEMAPCVRVSCVLRQELSFLRPPGAVKRPCLRCCRAKHDCCLEASGRRDEFLSVQTHRQITIYEYCRCRQCKSAIIATQQATGTSHRGASGPLTELWRTR